MFIKFRLAIFLNVGQRSITGGIHVGKVTDCININGSIYAPKCTDCFPKLPAGQVLAVGSQYILKVPNLITVEIPLAIFDIIGNAKFLILFCYIFKFLFGGRIASYGNDGSRIFD